MAKNRCNCFHCLNASGEQKKIDKRQGRDKKKYQEQHDEYFEDLDIGGITWRELKKG